MTKQNKNIKSDYEYRRMPVLKCAVGGAVCFAAPADMIMLLFWATGNAAGKDVVAHIALANVISFVTVACMLGIIGMPDGYFDKIKGKISYKTAKNKIARVCVPHTIKSRYPAVFAPHVQYAHR